MAKRAFVLLRREIKMKTIPSIATFMALALVTTSCTPISAAVGTGAVVGTAASREGGVGQAWDDTRIAAYINDAWFRHSTEMFSKLTLTIMEGRVLITGAVQKPEHRDAAVRFAWQAPEVRQVINEIRVEPSGGITGYAKDSWISTQMRTKLIADAKIESIQYKFDVDKAIVYILGIARDQEELERVINHARNISYVKEVVSYIRLRTDLRPDESRKDTYRPAAGVSTGAAASNERVIESNVQYETQQLQPIDLVPPSSKSIQSEDLAPPTR